MLAAMVLAVFTVLSSSAITHGFASYYTASRLLVSGELGPLAYDDRWFGEVVQRVTGTNVREIFTPNPPTMALMALPLAHVDASSARIVWLVVSLLLFLAAVAALVRYQAARNRDLPVPILWLMLLSPAVFTNLRIGQAYLIVFAMFAATAVFLLKGRPRLAGLGLGSLLALKMNGAAVVLILITRRQWIPLAWTAVAAAGLALAVTPFIDISMWWAFPSEVQAFVARPAGSVTAYQTTLSLMRHLCVADPEWNPSPAASCAPIAFIVPAAITAAATLITVVLARRTARDEAWIAAAATLSVLSLPAAAESHFVLMAVPLALVSLGVAELAVIAALLIVPLEFTAERFTSGWWSLLAYPRLYAGWLLWAASIREMTRFPAAPKST